MMILLIFLPFTIFSQNSELPQQDETPQIAKVLKSYEYCLNHDNEGVVESAIGNVLNYKVLHPDADMLRIKIQLERLSRSGETRRIRYKAFLVSQIIENPELLTKIEKKVYKDAGEFFELLAGLLQEQLVYTP
jgi:hypothetical protein